MASTSETGHVINIENYRKVIDKCELFPEYAPPNDDLTIVNMTAQWEKVSGFQADYIDALENTKDPVNDREVLFIELDRIVVRTLNNFECTKATTQAKKDAKGLVDKITGCNVHVERLENDVPDPNHISNSQQSFIKKVDNFEMLVVYYAQNDKYTPNENSLKIANLQTMLANLKAANKSVDKLISLMEKARRKRNHGLYDIGIGIIDVSLACKKYVRSLYGARSQEAKSVTSIYLKRIMRLQPIEEDEQP